MKQQLGLRLLQFMPDLLHLSESGQAHVWVHRGEGPSLFCSHITELGGDERKMHFPVFPSLSPLKTIFLSQLY